MKANKNKTKCYFDLSLLNGMCVGWGGGGVGSEGCVNSIYAHIHIEINNRLQLKRFNNQIYQRPLIAILSFLC